MAAAATPGGRVRGTAFAWAAALVLGFLLRVVPLTAARPYIAYVDEGNFLHPAFGMIRSGVWDPGDYLYPQFPRAAVAAVGRAVSRARRLAGADSLRPAIRTGTDLYDELEPFSILLAARALSLVAGLGIIVVAGRLAGRLGGGVAGAATALLAAVVPALTLRGSIASVDSYATLAAGGCLLATDAGRSGLRPRAAALVAGILAGIAFASKYPAVMVILAFCVTTVLLDLPRAERLRRLALGAVGLAIGAILGMPVLLCRGAEVLGALRLLKTVYAGMPTEPPLWSQALVRSESTLSYSGPELGWPLAALAVAGLATGLRRRSTAPTIAGWCAFSAAALALFGSQTFQPFRNLMPLVPIVCAAAGIGYAAIRSRVRRPVLVDAVGAAALVALFVVPMAAHAKSRFELEDSRRAAVDWLAVRAGSGDGIVVVRELAILESETSRLPGPPVVARRDEAPARIGRDQPRFVVAGVLTRPDGSPDPAAAWPELASYRPAFRAGRRPTAPLTGWWRGNDEIVVVFERRDAGAAAAVGREGSE